MWKRETFSTKSNITVTLGIILVKTFSCDKYNMMSKVYWEKCMCRDFVKFFCFVLCNTSLRPAAVMTYDPNFLFYRFLDSSCKMWTRFN